MSSSTEEWERKSFLDATTVAVYFGLALCAWSHSSADYAVLYTLAAFIHWAVMFPEKH